MFDSWSKFTTYGTAELEQQVRQIVSEVAGVVNRMMKPSEYRSLVLIGGYGRGEGGVEIRGDVAYPHNNLDFLLITNGLSQKRQARCREQVDQALAALRERSGIGIDFSTTSARKLRSAPSLVMWYDMRFGHRTVLGDAQFVPSLKQFSVERIPAWDVRNLLVNRGTLFVINDLLLDSGADDDAVARTIIKHIMKGVIGYGDALLYFLGRYHWSYAEKQQRMQTSMEASPEFRELYEEAISFRFQPCYDKYVDRDLKVWMADLRRKLAEVHLQCEEMRLKKLNLTWEQYVVDALESSFWCDIKRPRALARKAINLVRGPRGRMPVSRLASLGARVSGIRGALPILFPIVAYELQSEKLLQTAAVVMKANNTSPSELRRAYLSHWGLHGDDNFASFLRQHQVSLTEPRTEASRETPVQATICTTSTHDTDPPSDAECENAANQLEEASV